MLLLAQMIGPTLRAQAQKPPPRDTINSDRPDQTESPHIVAKGKLQAEAGITVNPFDSSDGETPVIGMLVLRYGLSKKIELRLMAEEGRNRDRYIEETTQGLYPLAIGGKWLLLERERGIVPQMALMGWVKLPFSSRSSEQTIYWSPQVLMAFENKIGEKIEIEYNAGGKQDAYDKEWEGMASLSLHYELSGRLKLFVEYFGHYQPQEDPVHNADAGLLYLINPSLQLDMAFGRSAYAVPEKKSSFVNAGFSIRLPH